MWLFDPIKSALSKASPIVLMVMLSYNQCMKLTLLLCVSLLFSMLHAAAMPMSILSDTQVETKAHTMDHMSFHCDNMAQDGDHKVHNCCSGAALQTVFPMRLMVRNSHKKRASLAPRLIRLIPDVLLKPPKVHLVLTG